MLTLTLPDKTSVMLPEGTNLLGLAKKQQNRKSPIVEATIDGFPVDLQAPLLLSGKVDFVEMESEEGMRIYLRTLICLLITTTEKLFPGTRLEVRSTLGSAIYIADKSKKPLGYRDWQAVENAMHAYVKAAAPISLRVVLREDAMEIARKNGQVDGVEMLETLPEYTEVPMYTFEGRDCYLFGHMCPDMSYVPLFELIPYGKGIVLNYPDKGSYNELPPFEDEPLLQNAFEAAEEWCSLIGCNTVAKMNRLKAEGRAARMIQVCEAWQERKLAEIADWIYERRKSVKLVLIAGPSSSGKTSTAQRLTIELAVNGINPLTISMDDYYVNRVDTPLKEDGSYDYECIEAIDIKLFNEHLNKLIAGEEVELPKYNFKSGCREYRGNRIKMGEDTVLIVEGIHGLNDKLTASIPAENKLKIYVSALTPISLDEHTRLNTTNVRLLRRMVRDNQFRGHNAVTTLTKWDDVREGEAKYIFPFQNNADVIFNSTLIYELAVMKKYAVPLLKAVKPSDGPAFTTAQRLLAMLWPVCEIEEDVIPNNSIIKEFIGGSVFKEAL